MKSPVYLCGCNQCGSVFIDTNPQTGAPKFNVNSMVYEELELIEDMRACPVCKTDEFLMDIDTALTWFSYLPIEEKINLAEQYTESTGDNTNIVHGMNDDAVKWICKNYLTK